MKGHRQIKDAPSVACDSTRAREDASCAGPRPSEDVDGGVDDYPHDVDEVPVDPWHVDAAVLFGAVMAAECSDRDEQQQAQPDEDVRAVQAGEREEDRRL